MAEWISTEVPLSLRKATAPHLCEEMKKVTDEEDKYKNMKELKSRCLVTAFVFFEAMELLIIRLIQFGAFYLDCSDMENAELHDLPAHCGFFILFSLTVCSEAQNFQIPRPFKDIMK